jgi:hypothetical protein
MFSRLQKHFGTAGLIVAIAALIAALAGGAIAATGGSSGHATASSQGSKVSPDPPVHKVQLDLRVSPAPTAKTAPTAAPDQRVPLGRLAKLAQLDLRELAASRQPFQVARPRPVLGPLACCQRISPRTSGTFRSRSTYPSLRR